ncbi:MAG: glycine dehydrogenase (aminomethyl-transferring) [Euryarchaeota archaeon RBG_19FT_COMBO_56_21]|nr:MAG: glycine dehydrogenase (aminomethyl-transferring) [Euryarchaeota archaeon RBG_19FT_COMBO_56_21]
MALSECSLEMLQYLKLKSVEELFSDIPPSVRTGGLRLPDGLTELELTRELEAMMSVNRTASQQPTFLGAGVYHHFIPAAVKTIVMRSEFITSYTPYQPEISQGMLQALFEYQSFMTELTGMDVVNCSMYDASSALGEAVLMSHRISGGSKFLISRAVSPEKKLVARTYARGADIQLTEVGYDPATGSVDINDLKSKLDPDVSGFYYESPNFLGLIEPQADEIRSLLGTKTMVVGVNPMALALIRPPADHDADIVIGDAQVFGSAMNLGGPMIGLFGCKMDHVRKMPGRLIGLTVDADNRRSYCMTLQTREQNIRRGKATSNICTNEALLAVASAAYLSVVGKSGLRDIAVKNVEHAYLLANRIGALKGFRAPHFKGTHFNEFVVTSDIDPKRIHEDLLSKGIHGGFPLGKDFPELKNSVLYATTEMHTKGDHDRLVNALEAVR